jgi:hypothetical protein
MVQNHRGVGFCCFERKERGERKGGGRESKKLPIVVISDSPVLGGYFIFLITVSSF